MTELLITLGVLLLAYFLLSGVGWLFLHYTKREKKNSTQNDEILSGELARLDREHRKPVRWWDRF